MKATRFKSEDMLDSNKIDACREYQRDMLLNSIIKSDIEAAVEALPSLDRQVIVLAQYHGFSAEDIAEICGISVDDARNCLDEATEKIKEYLRNIGSDDSHIVWDSWKLDPPPSFTDKDLEALGINIPIESPENDKQLSVQETNSSFAWQNLDPLQALVAQDVVSAECSALLFAEPEQDYSRGYAQQDLARIVYRPKGYWLSIPKFISRKPVQFCMCVAAIAFLFTRFQSSVEQSSTHIKPNMSAMNHHTSNHTSVPDVVMHFAPTPAPQTSSTDVHEVVAGAAKRCGAKDSPTKRAVTASIGMGNQGILSVSLKPPYRDSPLETCLRRILLKKSVGSSVREVEEEIWLPDTPIIPKIIE